MSSRDATKLTPELTPEERQTLLGVARDSVNKAAREGTQLMVDAADYPSTLRVERGCFVTLRIEEALRGCVGSLTARGPLVTEVARAGYMAARRDPRFAPMTADEAAVVHIHISVLSTPEAFPVRSEADLVAKLRPGVDGLILEDGSRLGTFLPDVWTSLPSPPEFVRQLKLKAGLPADHWSDTVRVRRYVTESFE